jgi:hypothetical protein
MENIEKKYEDCGCETCKKMDVSCADCPVCSKAKVDKVEELSDEEISKNYESEHEHVDKWNNLEKACWAGYEQVGMKDKNGKRVPNCVPIKKSIFNSTGPQDLIPKNK